MQRLKEQTLLARTVALLQEHDLHYVATMTQLNYYWLRKVRDGEIKEPGVNKIESLYNQLSNNGQKRKDNKHGK